MQSGGPTLEAIRRIGHPSLLIYGDRSRWLRTCHLLAGTLPNAETVIVPGAGHFFPLLRPLVFASHLDAFLERAGAGAGATTAAGGQA